MTSKKIPCVMCGAAVELKRTTKRIEIGLDAPVTIEAAEVGHCDACGEDYEGITNLDGLMSHIGRELAQKPARLTPREIRFLRARLDLSGVDLARELGVKPETAYRWERVSKPAPMSLAAERLLRLMVLDTTPGRHMALSRFGVSAPAPRKFWMLRRGRTWIERKVG